MTMGLAWAKWSRLLPPAVVGAPVPWPWRRWSVAPLSTCCSLVLLFSEELRANSDGVIIVDGGCGTDGVG